MKIRLQWSRISLSKKPSFRRTFSTGWPLRNSLSGLLSYLQYDLSHAEQKSADVTSFIQVVQKYENITELTHEIMHELIEKIIVHAPDKSSGHRTQEIEIHYRFDVVVATAVADSMKYDKKRKAA